MEYSHKIEIHIPKTSKTNFNEGFSIEENYLMLEIGSCAVLSMKKEMFGMKEDDKEKIKSELNEYYKTEINGLTLKNMFLKTEYTELLNKQKEELERKTEEINNMKIELVKEKFSYKMEIDKEVNKKIQDEIERTKESIEKDIIKRFDGKIENNEIIKKQLSDTVDELKKQMIEKTDEIKKQKVELETLRERETEGYKKEIKQSMEQREKENKVMIELNEKLEDLKKKSIVQKGNDGEKQFYDLALNTFRDFKMFEIKNTSKISHMGDFHLVFEEFTVLVDCKKYSNNVNSTNREKLKRDLTHNKNIKIAWMVSLDSSIDKYEKYPFMIDNIDIQNGICICYINSLLTQHDPEKLLKMIWYTCEIIHNSVLNNDDSELTNLKNNQKQIIEIAKQLNEISKSQFLNISQFEENCNKSNVLIKQLLTEEISKFRENDKDFVREWWSRIYEKKQGMTIKSSMIYELFKRQNSEYRIKEDSFKLILQDIIEPDNIVKQKSPSSPLKILNYSVIISDIIVI
jgi:hypothetical protein